MTPYFICLRMMGDEEELALSNLAFLIRTRAKIQNYLLATFFPQSFLRQPFQVSPAFCNLTDDPIAVFIYTTRIRTDELASLPY